MRRLVTIEEVATVGIWLQPLAVAALSLVVVAAGGAAAVELQPSATTVTAAPAQETLVPAAPAPAPVAPATCLPQPEAADSQHTADQQAGHTGVSFVVPPSTLIEVDRLGRAVAVSTNTGQAPCATDLFVQVAPDGARTPADATLRSAVLERHAAGPWTPGVAQPLTTG